MSAPTLEKILQAVNEKYGTSFEGWSQLPAAYEMGDNVPNWNAYEKIPFFPSNIIFEVENTHDPTGYYAGYYDNGIFNILSHNDYAIIVSNNGNVLQLQSAPVDALNWWKSQFEKYNLELSQVIANPVSYSVGDTIADFNTYKLLQ